MLEQPSEQFKAEVMRAVGGHANENRGAVIDGESGSTGGAWVETPWSPPPATTKNASPGPAKRKQLRERLSRSNRNCVLKLSSSYRNPMVKHEPALHISKDGNVR